MRSFLLLAISLFAALLAGCTQHADSNRYNEAIWRGQRESLEQLRVLWHGERIVVHLSPQRPGPGVDTPEDLARVRRIFEQRSSADTR